MKPLKYITAFILVLAIAFTGFIWLEGEQRQQEAVEGFKNQIEDLKVEIANIEIKARDNYNQIVELSDRVTENRKELENKVSRGDTKVRRMRATAYDLSIESCGKKPDHPQYGITRSGTKAMVGRTIAVDPKVIPLGSRAYVKFPLEYSHLDGVYIAEDTGRLVKGNMIDVFLGEDKPGSREIYKSVMKFGIQRVDVYILEAEE